ncbi:MAG TPA: glycine zipper 2TM domain-containing protein [Steroidobacteraceae bacterium]|nr:glycine zipper 2TM domain-containing protein [Steroidobacteraceae bacterium]
MTNPNLTGIALGGLLATGIAGYAGYQAVRGPGAEVLDVDPITHVVKTPRQECSDQVVTRQKPIKDEKRVAGTVTGAVVGAVIGHQIGGGTGKDIATVAGAAAGGYAGNKVQKHVQENNTYQTTENVCKTVYDSHTEETGEFRVRYRLKGKDGVVTMDHDPGRRIPVKDGELVLRDS